VSLGDILLGRESFDVVVAQPAPELIARLKSAVTASRAPVYRGEFSESGFILRRVAAHPKDVSASVVARGELDPAAGATQVHVTVRHGRAMVFFGWLLALLALGDAVATIQFAESHTLVMATILAGFAILWLVLLWRNIRQVGSDVRAMLTT
jgi:hypothetical protein